MGQGRVLSTDPNAGAPLRTAGGAPRVLSTDPNAGEPLRVATKRSLLDRVVSNPLEPSTLEDFPVLDLAKGAWNVVREIPAGLKQLVTDPIGSVQSMGQAQGRLGVEAKDAFDQGDYTLAARKGLHYLLPLIGPMIDPSADKMLEGKIAEATGEVATNALLTFAGAGPKSPAAARTARTAGRMTPQEAAAVEFARREGIPLDAGTATGSQFVKNLQKKAASSWGGANTAERAQAAQADALAASAERLASHANNGGPAVGAVEAGEGVRAALEGRVRDFHGQANRAYSRFRDAEAGAPEELVQARPRTPVTAGITPDQSFVLRWLADDLDELRYQPSSRMRGVRAIDEASERAYGEAATNYSPRVAGTPTQEMFHALGIKGTRAEISARLDNFLAGKSKDPRLLKLADALRAAWDGTAFDFDLIPDEMIAQLGVRRRELKSPMSTPHPSDMPEVYERWFGRSNEIWEAKRAAKDTAEGADDFPFGDNADAPPARYFPDEAPPAAPGGAGGVAAGDTPMRLAVDLRAHKEALRPLFDKLQKEREITGTLLGDKGRAAVALEALLNGPDFAPMSVVEAALGPVKKLARVDDIRELRTPGQGVAARVVGELDTAVRGRAQEAGPHVAQALSEGRAATRAKHQTADAMRLLAPAGAEPVSVFRRLTANKDAGVAKLRELQKHTPAQVPQIARALLEDILEKPTSEGGFKFADGAWARWVKVGPETKAILFPERAHRMALDNFFLLAKKIGENPNRSGTAQVMNATNLLAGLPMYGLAKLLYTPAGVRALTGVMELPVSPRASAARAAAIAELAHVAKDAGVVLELPKAAEKKQEQR